MQAHVSHHLQEYRQPETKPEAFCAGGWLTNTSQLLWRRACFDILIKKLNSWLHTTRKDKPACFQPRSNACVSCSGFISCYVTGGLGFKFIFRSICCVIVVMLAFTHLLFFMTVNEMFHFLLLADNRLVLTLACWFKFCSTKPRINKIFKLVIIDLNSGKDIHPFLYLKPSSGFCFFVFPAFLCLPATDMRFHLCCRIIHRLLQRLRLWLLRGVHSNSPQQAMAEHRRCKSSKRVA